MILMEKSQIMYGYTLLVPIVPIAGTNAGTEHNIMLNRTSCAQVHELPQSHCGDKHFFHDCIYIGIYIYAIEQLTMFKLE